MMPRSELQFPVDVEQLGILDEQGHIDESLVPDLDDDTLRRLYRMMLLSRRFDERLLDMQRQGRIGTFAPAIGQEAAQIGAAAALQERDWMVPSYRDSGAAIWRGTPLWGLILYDAGFNEGAEVPEGQNDLPIAVPVASQIPHAVGLAYALRRHGGDEVALVYFGDGATSEGDFHEALNFAAVWSSPVVFLCQNNRYAISTPLQAQMASETIAQRAVAYGMPGIRVDGNDVLAVYSATCEAVKRARAGDGPTLVECVTYRLSLHTTADDPSRYREESEVEEWRAKDPLDRLRSHLVDRGVLDEQGAEGLETEVGEQIDSAWEQAQARMEKLGAAEDMFDHLFAEPPPELVEQRRGLVGESASSGGGDG